MVLRDYALSYVLAALYSDADLGEVMAFKGGTALRKCFFPGYRFSEDLDFTMRERWDEGRIEAALYGVTERAVRLTAPYGRFRFSVERREHRGRHAFGQLDYRVTVDYPTGATLPIKPKEPTEVDRLKFQQKRQELSLKTQQNNDLLQARERELQKKSREDQEKLGEPKTKTA